MRQHVEGGDELRRDHRLVEDSLQRLAALLGGLDLKTDAVEVRSELDSLGEAAWTKPVQSKAQAGSSARRTRVRGGGRRGREPTASGAGHPARSSAAAHHASAVHGAGAATKMRA